MSYQAFITKWTSADYPPESVAPREFAATEAALGIRLPDSFKAALTQHGAATANATLLDAIVGADLELRDVQDFLTPSDMIETTRGWRELGLPSDAVAFATDCMEGLYCFKADSPETVWYWDHDFKNLEPIAPSFESWIASYCEIDPPR